MHKSMLLILVDMEDCGFNLKACSDSVLIVSMFFEM